MRRTGHVARRCGDDALVSRIWTFRMRGDAVHVCAGTWWTDGRVGSARRDATAVQLASEPRIQASDPTSRTALAVRSRHPRTCLPSSA